DARVPRLQLRRMAQPASGAREELPATIDRVRATRRIRRGTRSIEEPHEDGELLDGADAVGARRARDLRDVVRRAGGLAARVFLTLLHEGLVRDAHLDVVGLAREDEHRDVLRLPA